MISGDRNLAAGKQGAFYNTLEEFHRYWDRIDIICPRIDKVIHMQGLALQESYPLQGGTLRLFGNVFVHPSPWSIFYQPWWIFKKGQEIHREQKFDLVTVHEYPPFYHGLGARLLWQKIKVPYILEIHHIPGYPRAAGRKEIFYRYLLKKFIKRDSDKAAAVRVVNQNQVPEFLKKGGVPSEKIKYISSLYLDLETFRPMNLPKAYDLIFVGRLVENKGIQLLLKAIEFSIFNFQFPTKCLIVGDGPLMETLKLATRNQKLETHIHFHGWAKDSAEIAELINKSKVLVMPSYNEGNPRVVGEAMACGVPVLATPVGIVPDIIKPGISGEVIDWRADDIAGKAAALLADQNKYERYRLAGIEIAKNFEKKAMIKNYAEELKLMANQANQPYTYSKTPERWS